MLTRRAFAAGLLALAGSPARASDAAWEALKAGQAILLMRHAIAPGGGDPAGFKLGDCSTQCRTRETAALLGFDAPQELPPLDSFFGKPELGPQRRAAFMEWIVQPSALPRILVTHQVNITAFTGVVPASGEMVIVRKAGDGVEVLARVPV